MKKYQAASVPHQGTNPYLQYIIYLSDRKKEIQREVGKIDEVLSYAGGLFGIIISFLAFFLMSFNEYRYELMVAQGAFNYSEDGKQIKEHDFSFFFYIKYSIYDWVKVLFCY